MDEKEMIEDLVRMLDQGIIQGTGHFNVALDPSLEEVKQVRTTGCTDHTGLPMACSVPTLEEALDNFHDQENDRYRIPVTPVETEGGI